MKPSISDFIGHARSKGMDHQTIRMLLLSAGWKEKDISSALAHEALTMSIPLPPDSGSAKDAFFHLLTFTTLYSTVISLVVLAFQYIGRLLPDASALSEYEYDAGVSVIRWSIAVIVVSFPIFVLLARSLHRECSLEPQKLLSGVRRWLTYLTLFVTACTLIGDGITLLFYLLDGELTLRFFCKVLAILVLAGVPFSYYLAALRMTPEEYSSTRLHKQYLSFASALVVAFLVWGIAIVGSPLQGRMERFDQERVNHLRAIANQVYDSVYGTSRTEPKKFTQLPAALPKTLDDVAEAARYQRIQTQDPENGQPYEYLIEGSRFSLCAVFGLKRDMSYDVFWNHPAGRHCFSFDALDPSYK